MSDHTLWILAAALVLDAAIGDPAWLWRRTPHPVVMIGRIIAVLDHSLNRPSWPDAVRRLAGIAALLVVTGASAGVGWALAHGPGGSVISLLLAAILLAQNSLFQHVRAVATAFADGGLTAARAAVAQIVGRDPDSLDAAGVCRAAIESCAENFSDGVVAPAFWFAVAGLPGMLVYKAVNTADSMIGHRTPRHRAFGWAAARFDDVLNLPASRLAGALVTLAAPAGGARGSHCGGCGAAWRAMMRDAPRHRSPNAGWPEAAMAGALGIALAGPRRYHGVVVDDHWMGADGDTVATVAKINAALRIYGAACGLLLALIIGLAAAVTASAG